MSCYILLNTLVCPWASFWCVHFFMRAILVKAKVKKTLQPVSIASYHVQKIVPKQQ